MLGNGLERGVTGAVGEGARAVVESKMAETIVTKIEEHKGAFSKEERGRLNRLLSWFDDHFSAISCMASLREIFRLDEDHYPLNRALATELINTHERSRAQIPKGIFATQVDSINKQVYHFLIKRQQRTIGSGKPSDVDAMLLYFISTWARTCLNGSQVNDRATLEMIAAMENFLKNCLMKEGVLRYKISDTPRGKNNTVPAVVCLLLLQVNIVYERAQAEFGRSSTNDRLRNLVTISEGMIRSIGEWLYCSLGVECKSTFEQVVRAVSGGDEQKIKEGVRYTLKESKELNGLVGGRILYDMIRRVGAFGFGIGTDVKGLPNDEHKEEKDWFTQLDWPKLLKKTKKLGLPRWFIHTVSNERGIEAKQHYKQRLEEIHTLCQYLIQFSEAVSLLHRARTFARNEGDYWAYIDKRGHVAMKALLRIYRDRRELLYSRFLDLTNRDTRRAITYATQKKLKRSEPEMRQNSEAEDLISRFKDGAKSVLNILFDIQRVAEGYTGTYQEIKAQQKVFYLDIYRQLRKFQPDMARTPEYQLLRELDDNDDQPVEGLAEASVASNIEQKYEDDKEGTVMPQVNTTNISAAEILAQPITTALSFDMVTGLNNGEEGEGAANQRKLATVLDEKLQEAELNFGPNYIQSSLALRDNDNTLKAMLCNEFNRSQPDVVKIYNLLGPNQHLCRVINSALRIHYSRFRQKLAGMVAVYQTVIGAIDDFCCTPAQDLSNEMISGRLYNNWQRVLGSDAADEQKSNDRIQQQFKQLIEKDNERLAKSLWLTRMPTRAWRSCLDSLQSHPNGDGDGVRDYIRKACDAKQLVLKSELAEFEEVLYRFLGEKNRDDK